MKNSDYWKQRFTQLEDAQNSMGADAIADIEKAYRQAQKTLEGQINTWYQRFADNNNITMAEARQWLSTDALAELKWDLNDYIQYGEENAINQQWMKELENASAKFHISKLESLKLQTQNSLEQLYQTYYGVVASTMTDVYSSGYYHTAYLLQNGFNVGWNIAGLDQSEIEKIVSKPWATDGYNFSERIWGNKDKLIQEVHNALTQNIMLGQDPQKVIDEIAAKMNNSRTNAGRLVMTEEAYFSSAAQKDCFNDLGVERYEIVATLDSHTSDICISMDGQVFDMKDYEAGVTAPPFHVNCRSTTAPYFEDDFEDLGERAARDGDGNTYYVPDDMTYQEWEDKFVNGGDKSDLIQTMQNGVSVWSRQSQVQQAAATQKKTYVTKKKLQSWIADADVQIEDLGNQFKQLSNGESYEDAIKDYGTIEDYASAAGLDSAQTQAMKDIEQQLKDIEQQKEEWQEKLNEKLLKEEKKTLLLQQADLESQKTALEDQLSQIQIKTYSGIWYGKDVTTEDWASLNIQGKKDYYNNKLATETDPALIQKYQDLLDQVEELDLEGQNYDQLKKQLNDIQKQLDQVQKDLDSVNNGILPGTQTSTDPFGADAYTQDRKDAAYWFTNSNGGVRAADDVLRSTTEEVWANASKEEKYATYDYTHSYNKFNEPLRGIEYGTNKYLGVGNVDMMDIGVSYSGFKKGEMLAEIDAVTAMIDKSELKEDMWFQRGCNLMGMDKFFGVNSSVFSLSQSQLSAILVGTEPTEYAFMSCGVAKGKGLNTNGGILLNIYAPKGTKGLYLEPFSHYGTGVNGKYGLNGTDGLKWDGTSKQKSFGQEAEILFQRRTKMRVTKVEKSGGTIYIDVEVIGQSAEKGVY